MIIKGKNGKKKALQFNQDLSFLQFLPYPNNGRMDTIAVSLQDIIDIAPYNGDTIIDHNNKTFQLIGKETCQSRRRRFFTLVSIKNKRRIFTMETSICSTCYLVT